MHVQTQFAVKIFLMVKNFNASTLFALRKNALSHSVAQGIKLVFFIAKLSGNLYVNVKLSGNLYVNVKLSGNLYVNVFGICRCTRSSFPFSMFAHCLIIFVLKNRLFYANIMKIWSEKVSSLLVLQ
jgi:hypothetical protein